MKGENLQPRILYPARLAFRFDGEIKSFPDKQKLKRIQHHQTSFTTNAKGTSLGKKHKRRQRPTENKPKTINKIVTGSYILIITLNVNGLNTPTKRHRLLGGWKHACMHFHFPHRCLTPQIVYNYFILLIMFPLWLAIVIIFYCLATDCENWWTSFTTVIM